MDPVALDAVGLSAMMAGYLRVWEGADALRLHPDLEFVAALQLTGAASRVSPWVGVGGRVTE